MCFSEFFVSEVIIIYAGWLGVAELNATGMLVNFAYMSRVLNDQSPQHESKKVKQPYM